VKFVSNVLKRPWPYSIILNFIKGSTIGFVTGEESRFLGDASNYNLENEQMGELIAFKPAGRRARVRSAPVDSGTVVFFTGVRQHRLEGPECVAAKVGEAQRARRVPVRQSRKCKGKAGARPKA
jgi:hypothetical protein